MINITTGTIQIRASKSDSSPVSGASVRVYKMQDKTMIFEAYYTTNADGMTNAITLDAPDIILSFNKNSAARPYETYNVEVNKSGYDIEQRIGVQIFASLRSSLEIIMNASRAVIPNRNVIVIDGHSLFENQGDRDA